MSSRSVCVDVILQFEHSSPSVILLLGVVVGGLCKYVVVVVLCNVKSLITCLVYCVSFSHS